MRLLPTCREVTHIVSESQDRALGPVERLRLHVHLSMCTGCTNFTRQLRLIRGAMLRLSEHDDDPS